MQAELLAEIYARLVERDAHEKSLAGIIEQHRRLSQQTVILRDRNRALLKASLDNRSAPNGTAGGNDGVRAAYVGTLETQIQTLRDELAAVYKTQSQNAQRLLVLTETLRESDDRARVEGEELRTLRLEVEKLSRKAEDAQALKREKERTIEKLTDELATLQLEVGQLEQRNADLQVDNQNILQRWLDKLNEEATQVNEANAFIESTSRLRSSNSSASPASTVTPARRAPSRGTSPGDKRP